MRGAFTHFGRLLFELVKFSTLSPQVSTDSRRGTYCNCVPERLTRETTKYSRSGCRGTALKMLWVPLPRRRWFDQRSDKNFNRSRPAEQITLEGAAALMGKEVPLLHGFHPLGNDRQTQGLTQGHDRPGKGGIVGIGE